ncbi:hypothetical protein L207DRAFT_509536 [Hyaloscypha variabilis F]|uniref:Uncharacterized protein n=1 Tax=Hyaloscypha variabilis (strain UAMH 11265 / GT02V1 / F) TaxID=1149755 RepID=A0A2J6RWR0_HYAVF|nr:hypothetical protein L207DRAFT_509536 [Hyaloscypha variabilis F]
MDLKTSLAARIKGLSPVLLPILRDLSLDLLNATLTAQFSEWALEFSPSQAAPGPCSAPPAPVSSASTGTRSSRSAIGADPFRSVDTVFRDAEQYLAN